MWGTILAVNSFVVFPAAFILFLYAFGRGILTWHWKLFVIAGIFLLIVILAEIVIAIIGD